MSIISNRPKHVRPIRPENFELTNAFRQANPVGKKNYAVPRPKSRALDTRSAKVKAKVKITLPKIGGEPGC